MNGWNSQARREFPGKFESTNPSRDTISREIGRTGCERATRGALIGRIARHKTMEQGARRGDT